MTNIHSGSTLKKPIAEWFSDAGYKVKFEVRVPKRIADVVVYKKQIIAIEIKESLAEIVTGISQCMEYSKAVEKVYLAFPEYLLEDFKSKYDYKNMPFGLLVVDEHENVKMVKESPEMNPDKKTKEDVIRIFRKTKVTKMEHVSERFEIENRELLKSPEIRRMLKKITVECVWMHILGLLMVKPRHAYTLREEIKKEFGFNIGRITAYKVLYNLKRRGYVRVVQRKMKSQRGPKRKYYEITENGKELLMNAGRVMHEFTCHFTGM